MTTPTPIQAQAQTSYTAATILLAHGSTDPKWLEPFNGMLEQIRAGLSSERVELAFMELAEPSLEGQIRSLATDGFQRIEILPLFFAAGRHLRKDVPAMIEAVQQELHDAGQNTEIILQKPIGLDPEVASAIQRIVIRQIKASET